MKIYGHDSPGLDPQICKTGRPGGGSLVTQESRLPGESRQSAAVVGAVYLEICGALLAAGPFEVLRHLGIGQNPLYGRELFGQGHLGEKGVELPMTCGAQRRLRTQTATFSAGNQVMYGEAKVFPATEFAGFGHFNTHFDQKGGAVFPSMRQTCNPLNPRPNIQEPPTR